MPRLLTFIPMTRRASLLLALVVLVFTVGAAMNAAASVEMSFKMISTTEAGTPPCDGCGDGGDGEKATSVCPVVCVPTAMSAALIDAATLPVTLRGAHRAPPDDSLTDWAAPPEPFPPRLT